MADRFPLIIDTSDGNRIKELPAGDNLDLSQSSIVNVAGITTLGTINAGTLLIDGQQLSDVAKTGSYNDLIGRPVLFSGDYVDLTNKPNIPTNLKDLQDVSLTLPTDGQGLKWSDADNQWIPGDISIDISTSNITDLNDVIITGAVENKFLKNYAGAWRPANVTWTDVQNRPTAVSAFENDRFYIDILAVRTELQNAVGNFTGSLFADDSTPLVDAINKEITTLRVFTQVLDSPDINTQIINAFDGVSPVAISTGIQVGQTSYTAGNIDSPDGLNISATAGDLLIRGIGLNISDSGGGTTIEDTNSGIGFFGVVDFTNATVSGLSAGGGSVGNFTFANSNIDTDDSSNISITPAVTMQSDLTVENDLVVQGNITSTAVGDPEIVSQTDILLTAVDRVTISQSPLKMASFTTTGRDSLTAENGDMIYNTTTNKFQGYANGVWVDLH